MQPDPPTSEFISGIVNGLGQGIVTVAAGAATGYLVGRAQRKRRQLTYEVQQISLLQLNPRVQGTLKVSVDKALLTGDASDAGTDELVGQAYVYEVTVRNTGNEAVRDISVDFEVLAPAKLASFETNPQPRPDYAIEARRDQRPNTIWLALPYLNRGGKAQLTVVGVYPAAASSEGASYNLSLRCVDAEVVPRDYEFERWAWLQRFLVAALLLMALLTAAIRYVISYVYPGSAYLPVVTATGVGLMMGVSLVGLLTSSWRYIRKYRR